MDEYKVIVNRSTVPVGSAGKVRQAVANELKIRGVNHNFAVISNAKFLKVLRSKIFSG